MCDYSLERVASRPARVGDKLISTSFPHTITRGFASVDVHHDALEFPDGKTVLLTQLCKGQRATVLQLPARTDVNVDGAQRTIQQSRPGWQQPWSPATNDTAQWAFSAD